MSVPPFSTIIADSYNNNCSSERRGPARRSVHSKFIGVCSLRGSISLYETFLRSSQLHPDRPCLGERFVDSNGCASNFVFRSYSECALAVRSIASGLVKESILHANDEGLILLGIYMKNCSSWVLAEYACYTISAATVPLYDTLGPETVQFVINQTQLSACLCSSLELHRLCNIASACPSLRYLLLNEVVASQEQYNLAAMAGLKLFTIHDIERIGRAFPCTAIPPSAQTLATFCYTSGTTGDPKGALISHKNIISVAAAALNTCFDLRYDDHYLSFLPLPHIFERMVISALLSVGSAIGFFRGDPLKLIEDCIALRPSVFCAVPRLLNKIYDKVELGMLSGGGLKAMLYKKACSTKLQNLKTGILHHTVFDFLVFDKIKTALGLDKVRIVVSGGAPLSLNTMNFLRILFGVNTAVHEGYGLTESTGGISITAAEDLSRPGHVGPPLPVVDVCLCDVPDMGYFHTDVMHDDQRCDGRGEILVKGPNIFSGYYKNSEATSEVLSHDGWLRTGDIGLWQPNGQLAIIDRKKNLLKLSQGEYVAVEKIENILGRASLINQIYVHGESTQNFVVGIVVPDMVSVQKLSNNATNDHDALKSAVLAEIQNLGKAHGLQGFEIVKNIYIDINVGEWGPHNGLTTPTHKLKRQQLRERYKNEIDNLYKLYKAKL